MAQTVVNTLGVITVIRGNGNADIVDIVAANDVAICIVNAFGDAEMLSHYSVALSSVDFVNSLIPR